MSAIERLRAYLEATDDVALISAGDLGLALDEADALRADRDRIQAAYDEACRAYDEVRRNEADVVADRDRLAAECVDTRAFADELHRQMKDENDRLAARVAELEAAAKRAVEADLWIGREDGTSVERREKASREYGAAWAALACAVQGSRRAEPTPEETADAGPWPPGTVSAPGDRRGPAVSAAAFFGEDGGDADPCPVHFDTVRRSIQVSGDTWGFSSKASAEAVVDALEWLTRRAQGRGR